MTSRAFAVRALAVLGILLVAGSAAGQAGRGTARISGTVVDETGSPVPGAKITIVLMENESVRREVKADKKGEWAIIGLGTSQWSLTAVADGFQPTVQNIHVRQLERNPAIIVTLKRAAPTDKPLIEDEASLALIDQGNQLYNDGKYDEALAQFRDVLARNPKLYQINLSIGDCLREKGETDAALDLYRKVAEEASVDAATGQEVRAKALARVGDAYLRKGDVATAQSFFKDSIEASPQDEILAYNVGEIYFSNQNLDEAIAYFELATRIKPGFADGHYKAGLAYLNKGDYDKARQSLAKVLELEPEGERAASVKGILETIDKIKK